IRDWPLPKHHERHHQYSSCLKMMKKAPHGFCGCVRVGDQLKGARRHQDGAISSRYRQRLHALLEKRGVKTKFLRFLSANRQHLWRVIDAINIDPSSKIVEQQTACSASDIQSRLAVLKNNVSTERSVRLMRSIPTPQVP